MALPARLGRNAARVRFSRAWLWRCISRVLAAAPVVRAGMARRDKVTAPQPQASSPPLVSPGAGDRSSPALRVQTRQVTDIAALFPLQSSLVFLRSPAGWGKTIAWYVVTHGRCTEFFFKLGGMQSVSRSSLQEVQN